MRECSVAACEPSGGQGAPCGLLSFERLVDRCLGGGKGLQAEQRERRDGGLLLGNGVGLLSLVERRRIRGWLWGVLRLIPKRQVFCRLKTSMCV